MSTFFITLLQQILGNNKLLLAKNNYRKNNFISNQTK